MADLDTQTPVQAADISLNSVKQEDVDISIHDALERAAVWVTDKYLEAKALREDLRNNLDNSLDTKAYLLQLKELVSEAKAHKTGITGLIRHGNDHSLSNPADKPLDFDNLADLKVKWLELKQLLKDLGREARNLTGRSDHQVYLCYSTTDKDTLSPQRNLFPSISHRRLGINRKDPNKSFLKEKGRTFVTKLSIPYRVFIKSKVKQRHFGRKSADSSFADTSVSELSFDSSSLNSSRSYSPTCCHIPDIPADIEIKDIVDAKTVPHEEESEEDDRKSSNNTTTHYVRSSDVRSHATIETIENQEKNNNSNTKLSKEEEVVEDIMTEVVESSNGSPKSPPRSGTRASPVPIEEYSPITYKRRRLNSDDDSASSTSSLSPRGSPVPIMMVDSPSGKKGMMTSSLAESLSFQHSRTATLPNNKEEGVVQDRSDYMVPEAMRGCGPAFSPLLSRYPNLTPGTSPIPTTQRGTPPSEDLFNLTFDGIDSSMSSALTTPTDSPYPTLSRDFRKKYKKDELWAAIQSDYHYLMDDEIIETCKSTESDLSWESDEVSSTNTNVSFTEFLKQYKELTDWLNQIQAVTQRNGGSHSERYLNQSYHEEMLQRSARRKVFNDYARQLIKRYPTMKEEIQARLLRVNTQWEELEKAVIPGHGEVDEELMLRNLEEDMGSMRRWLHKVEGELSTQVLLSVDWTPQQIHTKIEEHKLLQQDIESHSKLVSAVLKVCERLQSGSDACTTDDDKDSVKLVATNLERRWHAIWIQSLEWECRLVELQQGKGHRKRLLLDEDSEEEIITACSPIGTQTECGVSSDFGTDPISFTPDRITTKSTVVGGESDADSDTSNYDIIPFSEHEYEKILVDTDNSPHPDDDEQLRQQVEDGKSSPDSGGHYYRTSSGCETDHGLDSALGRSYSDHSIGGDNHKSVATCGNGPEVKFGINNHAADMKSSKKAENNRAVNELEESTKRDASDVGYSSGSHSNEELDVKGQGRNQKRAAGEKKKNNSKGDPEATSSPNLGNTRKTWRNSATSAYDTCSTGSDPSLQLVGEENYLDLTDTHNTSSDVATVTSTSFHSVVSTPHTSPEVGRRANASFYHMTSIETDTDPSSSVEPASTYSYTADHYESGNTSDIDSELSKSLDIPYDEDPGFNIPPIPEEEMVNEIDQPKSKKRLEPLFKGGMKERDDNKGVLPTDDCLSQEELDSLTDAAHTLLKYIGKGKPFKKTDSLSVLVDSEASSREQALSEDEIGNVKEEILYAAPKGPSDCVRKLIQQAESLVGDEDLNQLNNHKWPQFVEPIDSVVKSKGRNRHKRKAVDINDSFTSTDGSVRTGVPLSSCDASSEGDFSGSWSDSSEPCNSNNAVGLTTVIEAGALGNADSLHGPVKLRRKNRNTGERPHSVTELYEQRSGLDMAPFSISDGAIPILEGERSSNGSLGQRLHKYTSNQSSSSPLRKGDSPRKVRKRRSPPKKGLSSGSLSKSHSGQDRRSVSPPTISKGVAGHSASNNTAAMATGLQPTSDTDMDTLVPECPETADEVDSKASQQTLSGVEFSENAWDNYQAPPYTNISDDGGEEKLDASQFQGDWDHGLEFEEDFSQDQRFGGGSGALPRDKKQPGKPVKRVFDDSDSDLEDFQNVIAESQKALTFTDNTLVKPRKDNMETGIYLDPSEYNETLATCRTQMKCLGVVVSTLQSEMGLTNVTEDNIQQVIDIIEEWRELESLALERLHQSQKLGSLYKDMLAVQMSLDTVHTQLDYTEYRDVGELEGAVKALQSGRINLQQQKLRVDTVLNGVVEFENNQESINMCKFHTDLTTLRESVDQLSLRLTKQSSDLQSALVSMYDFSEHQRELQHILNREKQQLRAKELAQSLVTFTPQEAKETLQDLKKLEIEFPAYNGKLQLLRSLHRDIAPFCHRDKSLEIKTQIAVLDNELADLRHSCETLTIKVAQSLNRESVATQAGGVTKVTTATSASTSAAPKRSLLMRLLRASLPLQLLLLFLLVLAYFMNPDMFENFGLVFSPQLRYVRGPPPT